MANEATTTYGVPVLRTLTLIQNGWVFPTVKGRSTDQLPGGPDDPDQRAESAREDEAIALAAEMEPALWETTSEDETHAGLLSVGIYRVDEGSPMPPPVYLRIHCFGVAPGHEQTMKAPQVGIDKDADVFVVWVPMVVGDTAAQVTERLVGRLFGLDDVRVRECLVLGAAPAAAVRRAGYTLGAERGRAWFQVTVAHG